MPWCEMKIDGASIFIFIVPKATLGLALLEAVAKPVLSLCQGTVLAVPNKHLQNSGFSR